MANSQHVSVLAPIFELHGSLDRRGEACTASCEMENCADHGPGRATAGRQAAERRARRADTEIQVSPRNMAHFPGCLHKGDDEDFAGWGFIRDVKDAWTRLGNGEQIATNSGVARVATSRCLTCEDTDPLAG